MAKKKKLPQFTLNTSGPTAEAAAEIEVTDAYDGRPRKLTVEVESGGITVTIPGHGTAAMMPECGSVVFLEFRNGVPFLIVWGDITQEDPTHTIDMSGASESLRRD